MNRSPHIEDETLMAAADKSLPPDELEHVEAHLGTCNTCQARFEEHLAFHQRITQSLHTVLDEIHPLTPPSMVPVSSQTGQVFLRVALAAAVLLGVGGVAFWVSQSADAPSKTARVSGPLATSVPKVDWSAWPLTSSSKGVCRVERVDTSSNQVVVFGGASAPEGFCQLNQHVSAEGFLGKRVRYSARVRTANLSDWAGLWMRLDGRGKGATGLAFDNMGGRPLRGTQAWQRHSVVLDVPNESVILVYGVLIRGEGRVWIDDVQVEVVGEGVAVTGGALPATLLRPQGD